jgi:hypothetical protein
MNKLSEILSLADLEARARKNEKYARLAIKTATDLGGFVVNYPQAITYLKDYSEDEEDVVEELNVRRFDIE